jgi:hypothetical protein
MRLASDTCHSPISASCRSRSPMPAMPTRLLLVMPAAAAPSTRRACKASCAARYKRCSPCAVMPDIAQQEAPAAMLRTVLQAYRDLHGTSAQLNNRPEACRLKAPAATVRRQGVRPALQSAGRLPPYPGTSKAHAAAENMAQLQLPRADVLRVLILDMQLRTDDTASTAALLLQASSFCLQRCAQQYHG